MKFTAKTIKRGGGLILSLELALFIFLVAINCQKENRSVSPQSQDIELEIAAMSECKSQFMQKKTLDTTSNYDCMEYEYSSGVLSLNHINAGFNCCPEIDTEIEIADNLITIREIEVSGQCDCECLFDLDLIVRNLSPGEHRIKVLEPLVNDNDEPLEFTVDLVNNPDGVFCVERHHYPWDMD